MVLKNNLLLQLMRFGIVGISAACLHFTGVVILVESGLLTPLLANVIAYGFAFPVSYFGHRYWTFHTTTALHSVAMPRLLLISTTNFFANEGLFYIFMSVFNLSYPIALLIVLTILPIATFFLSKFWVFR